MPAPVAPGFWLEKHADFLNNYRGEAIHSWTLELMLDFGVRDWDSRPDECRGKKGGGAGQRGAIILYLLSSRRMFSSDSCMEPWAGQPA